MKFHDHIRLSYGPGIEQALDQMQVAPWHSVVAKFSGITIGPLNTTLKPKELRDLAARATRTDPEYRPPNFLTHFAINCPPGIDPEEVVTVVKVFRSVETVYFQSPPLPRPVVNAANNPRYPSQGYLQAAPHAIAGLVFSNCEAPIDDLRSFKCNNWEYADPELSQLRENLAVSNGA